MSWNWKNIKESAVRTLSDIDHKIDNALTSASDYLQQEIIPDVKQMGADIAQKTKTVIEETASITDGITNSTKAKLADWSQDGKAKHIPDKYANIVKTALITAAAAGPLGVTGGVADTIAIAGIWTTMFLAIRSKTNSSFGNDPKRIASGVASGIVKYYIGCKLATYACFLIPGAGIFAGMSVSAICNIYFTYNFASILIELMDTKSTYSDDDIIKEIISLIRKMPSTEEIKEIVYLYQH